VAIEPQKSKADERGLGQERAEVEMKRARVKEAALAVLIREGFNAETAERLADLIADEPIPAGPEEKPSLEDRLSAILEECPKESH